MTYRMFRRVALLMAGVVFCSVAAADGQRETLGLWTFDGENGQTVVSSYTVTSTIPNQIVRTDTMRLDLEWPASASSKTPLPTYTNDLQYAYLFDGLAQTKLIKTCTTAMQIKHENWTSKVTDGSWSKPHAYLALRDVGALIKGQDWTLEVIAYLPDRSSSWAQMLYLGTATGTQKHRLYYRTNGAGLANAYGNSATFADSQYHNFSYPRFEHSTIPSSQQYYTVYPDDARWHHIAWKWTESTRSLKCYVDYGDVAGLTMNWWNGKETNLELDDGAYMNIFGFAGSNNHMPTVQAVRLTRGNLPVRDFLCTSKFASLPETVGHWRYEGTPGETNCLAVKELEQPNRSDLQLWKHDSRYPLAYVAPQKAYVRSGGKLLPNSSAIAASNPSQVLRRCYMSCMQTNPYWTLPSGDGSFTYETFVWLDKAYLGSDWSDDAVIFAERGGAQGNTDWQGENWCLCQEKGSSADELATMRLVYWQAPDAGGAGTKITKKFKMTTGAWHHVALTYDAPNRTIKVYVDRKLPTQTYYSTAPFSITLPAGYHLSRGTQMLTPGECNAMGVYHAIEGRVDELRITRRALEPSEFLRQSANTGMRVLFR